MSDKTTVAFRIDESVKQEWEEAAEAPEYNSLSHLIRLSVQREITDSESQQTDTPSGMSVDRDEEVLEALNRIEATVADVQAEVSAIETETRADELYELEQVLLELLPEASDTLDPNEIDSDTIKSEAATARSAAGRIGADTSDVSDALERLCTNTGQVRSIVDKQAGETYYWRIV